MPGSKEASQKRRETMIKKLGSKEAYMAFMRRNAGLGGKLSKRPSKKDKQNDMKPLAEEYLHERGNPLQR